MKKQLFKNNAGSTSQRRKAFHNTGNILGVKKTENNCKVSRKDGKKSALAATAAPQSQKKEGISILDDTLSSVSSDGADCSMYISSSVAVDSQAVGSMSDKMVKVLAAISFMSEQLHDSKNDVTSRGSGGSTEFLKVFAIHLNKILATYFHTGIC